MRYERAVEVLRPDGGRISYTIEYGAGPPWVLTVETEDRSSTHYEAPDLYEAMRHWRRDLEATGQTLLCQGARPSVFPSSMGSDMGGGIKAYVNQFPPYRSPLEIVDIFDEAPLEEVGTLEQQHAFRRQWQEKFHRRVGILTRWKLKLQSLWWKARFHRGGDA